MNSFYFFVNKIIQKIDVIIFKKIGLWKLYLLSLVYIALIYGFGYLPSMASYYISKNPFVNIFAQIPEGQYNYDSILIPMFAYLTGLNRRHSFFLLLNFLLILLGNILFIQYAKNRYSVDAAKLVILFFLLVPISTVLFTWLGSYDSMTYLLQSCLLFSSYPIFFVFIGFLSGLNHFPTMLFSGVTLLVFKWIAEENKRYKKYLLSYLFGLIIGYILLKYYQKYFELGITVDRLGYLQLLGLEGQIKFIFGNFLTLIFSLYNVLWIVVIFIVHYLFENNKKLFYVFLASNGLYLMLTAVVIDSTRIFSFLAYPLLITSFLYVYDKIKQKDMSTYISLRHFLIGVVIVGLFIPRLIIWQGAIYFSVSWEFFMTMFRKIYGYLLR